MNDEIISAYRAAAVAHGAGTQSGDADQANRAHDELQELLDRLHASQQDRALLDLLEDEDPWVQLWAAAHTLEVDEVAASEKLTALSEAAPALIRLTARYTLKEWNDGGLSFR